MDRLSLNECEGTDLAHVLAYWRSVREATLAPDRRRFRLDELPPKVVPSIAVVDFIGVPVDYYYRFFGSKMVEAAGAELTGKCYFADDIQEYGFINAEIFPRLIKEKEPLLHKTRWLSTKRLTYGSLTLRLPLSSDGETVDGAVTANIYSFQ